MKEQINTPSGKKTSFAGDVLKLLTGTAIAQALPVLASPFLTRLFGPDVFGVSALFASIMTIVSVIVCLRYEQAIMLPESDKEAANLMVGSLLISAILAFFSIPIVWFGGSMIARLLNATTLIPYLWLVPPTILFGGIGIGHPALNFWAARTKNYGQLSVTRVIGAIVTVVTQLGGGFAGFTSAGSLIGASVLGSVVSPLALGWQIWRQKRAFLRQNVNWQGIMTVYKRYQKFPIVSTWSALLNTLSTQLPTLMLSMFFSTTIVGYYALGYRTLSLPSLLVGTSIAQVFFQRASEARIHGLFSIVVEKTFQRLIMFGMFPLLVISISGGILFTAVFGPKWTEAGVYAQILAPWVLFVFISSPISTLINILEKQEVGLIFNIVMLISRAMVLVLGGLSGNTRITLALFSVTGVALYLWMCFWLLTSAGISISRVLRILVGELIICIPFIGGIMIFSLLLRWQPWPIVAFISLVTLSYYLTTVYRDPSLQKLIFNFIRKIQFYLQHRKPLKEPK